MVGSAVQFDDFSAAAAPLVRNLCHVPERGEEHVDGPDNVDRLIAAFDLGVNKTAFEPNADRLIDEKAGTRERHRPAPENSDSATAVFDFRSMNGSLPEVNFAGFTLFPATGEPAFVAQRSVRPKLPILAPTGQE